MFKIWESFGFLKYTGGDCVIFLEWRMLRRWWRARSSVCARKAGASLNGISRKQQQWMRACSDRAGMNGRARKHSFVRLDRAPKHQRARAGWAGGG